MSVIEAPSLEETSSHIAAIAEARTMGQAIEIIRSSARALIGCDGIAVIRRDGKHCHYVEEDAIGALWKGQKFPISACVSGWSMLNRQTVVIPDIRDDERIPIELYLGTFVRAMAMAPINNDNPVGAIGAYWAIPRKPSYEEVRRLEALANAAAYPMAG